MLLLGWELSSESIPVHRGYDPLKLTFLAEGQRRTA